MDSAVDQDANRTCTSTYAVLYSAVGEREKEETLDGKRYINITEAQEDMSVTESSKTEEYDEILNESGSGTEKCKNKETTVLESIKEQPEEEREVDMTRHQDQHVTKTVEGPLPVYMNFNELEVIQQSISKEDTISRAQHVNTAGSLKASPLGESEGTWLNENHSIVNEN